MKPKLVAFWLGSLAASLALSAVLFHYAAVPQSVVEKAAHPQAAEEMGSIDLGAPYGTVPVTDLVSYYVEHPPAATASGATDSGASHFGGC